MIDAKDLRKYDKTFFVQECLKEIEQMILKNNSWGLDYGTVAIAKNGYYYNYETSDSAICWGEIIDDVIKELKAHHFSAKKTSYPTIIGTITDLEIRW